MRITDREGLIGEPSGTLYAEYEPTGIVGKLSVKTTSFENMESDWVYFQFDDFEAQDTAEILETWEAMNQDDDYHKSIDLVTQRDGMFDHEQRFVIYDEGDITTIVKALVALL